MFFFPRKRAVPQAPQTEPAPRTSTPSSTPQRDEAAARAANSTRNVSDRALSSTTSFSPETDDHPLADYHSARLLSVRADRRPSHVDPHHHSDTSSRANSARGTPPSSSHGLGTSAPAAAGRPLASRGKTDSTLRSDYDEMNEAGRNRAVSARGPSGAAGASAMPPPATAAGHHEILMDFGDVYTGQVLRHSERNVLVPHGHGTLQSSRGRHCYVGNFNLQQRDGWGKLVTPRFAMWGAWKANRPDLSTSVRIDAPDGHKYYGYVEALTSPAPVTSDPVSKFSLYVMSVTFVKSGWGEMVYSDGKRYFGQWSHDQPSGYGVMLAPDGERYVGQWRRGQFHGPGVDSAANGLVYDGLWSDGRFHCSSGDVVFPRQIRIRGDWDDIHRFKNANIVLPERRTMTRPFIITSLFDPLFLGATEAARRKAGSSVAPLRAAFDAADTLDKLDKAFVAHLKVNDSYINTLKIARRVFYFMYGTCGASSLRGAGQKHNRLGWCYLRKSFGGCIHRAAGDPITTQTVSEALGDVLSFVVSAHRWFMHHLGSSREAVDDLDATPIMSRRILDSLLELIHAPLLNIYRHAYASEQLVLDSALQRLANMSMDDVGVSFARGTDRSDDLFVPYATAMNTLQRLAKATTFTAKLTTLVRWSVDIDDETRMNQIRLQSDEAMAKVATFFEKRRQLMRDDPEAIPQYADAIEADSPDEKHAIAQAMNVVGGSLDDLFPIQQFVLMKADVPDLVAQSRMIGDFSEVEWLLDSTSRESFCVTNFKACVSVVSELHPSIRDPTGVIAPTSAVVKRVEDVGDRLAYGSTSVVGPAAAAYFATVLDWLSLSGDGDDDASSKTGSAKAAASGDDDRGFSIVLLPGRAAGTMGPSEALGDGCLEMLKPFVVELGRGEESVRRAFENEPFFAALLQVAVATGVHLCLVPLRELGITDGGLVTPSTPAAGGSAAAFTRHTLDSRQAVTVLNGSTKSDERDTATPPPQTSEDALSAAGDADEQASSASHLCRYVLAAASPSVLGRCARELQLIVDALSRVAGVVASTAPAADVDL